MERSEKQLPNKGNHRTFLPPNCSNFKLKCLKGLKVTKNVKEIKFQGVWSELESK